MYPMDSSDPSTWIAVTAALVFVISMLPWYVTPKGSLEWSTGRALLFPAAAALILGIANWLIGSWWLVRLSELDLPNKNCAKSIQRTKARREEKKTRREEKERAEKDIIKEWRDRKGTV